MLRRTGAMLLLAVTLVSCAGKDSNDAEDRFDCVAEQIENPNANDC